MSREYERQEALRMTGNAYVDSSGRHSSAEPYINELVPVEQRPRRRPVECDSRRYR